MCYLEWNLEAMPRKTDKRIRLIESAKSLIHKQGFNLTTLADIAQEADVPLGNVYYYFKTKEAIGVAVIESRSQEWTERLAHWSKLSDPLARIFALVKHGMEDLETTARFGCSIGGLTQELGKQGGPLSDLAAKLLHDILTWSQEQFSALGFGDRSREYAIHLISGVQGAYLLTNTFKEPQFTINQSEGLMAWLEKLTGRRPETTTVETAVEEEAVM